MRLKIEKCIIELLNIAVIPAVQKDSPPACSRRFAEHDRKMSLQIRNLCNLYSVLLDIIRIAAIEQFFRSSISRKFLRILIIHPEYLSIILF